MQSINTMIEAQADARPDHLALTGFGGDYTYAGLRLYSWKVANAFIAAGFGNGTRFALFSPNAGCGVVAQLGSLKAGGVWCNVNLKNTVSDNIDILTRGGCEVFYYHSAVSADALHIVASVPSIKLALCIDEANSQNEYLFDWIHGASDAEPVVSIDLATDIGLQGNTGGTTGLPKLTQSPHSFLAINAKAFVDLMPVDGEIRNLVVAPITHAGGILLLGCLAAGATNFVMAVPTPGGIVEELEKRRITTLFLPPTLVYILIKYPEIETRDFSSLRYLMTAGAPMAAEKIVEACQIFGNVLCQALGQTEAGFPVTWISPEEVKEAVEDESKRGRLSSCGRKCQVLDDLAVMDEQGNILPIGEQGEIVMRGPTVMQGYLGDPEATAEVQKFGWHHTGDVGYLDDEGYLYLCDRKRDLIISGGFNIFPYEVEQVLLTHPAVQECAVVGVNDEKWGERVTGAIELAPGAELDTQALMDYCKEKIGSMKAPKEIVIMDSLPRSAVGKVLKREIRRALNERI